MKKPRLFRVNFWYVVDVEDPERKDARDAVEIAWKFLKVTPAGFQVKPYKQAAGTKPPGESVPPQAQPAVLIKGE
jgi:hypothetical protein